MAKKVNGIKVYPRYAVGSILSAVLCVAAGVFVILGTIVFPVFSVTIDSEIISANGADFLVLGVQGLGISGLDFLSDIASATHFVNAENFDLTEFSNLMNTVSSNASSCGNVAVSWYGSIGNYVFLAAGAAYLVVLVFSLFLIVIGIIKLIMGTYASASKPLSIFTFIFMFIFVIATFVTTFCSKYILSDTLTQNVVCDYCWAPYAAWGVCLLSFVVQSWVKTLMVNGKLYVPGARKIKKSKDYEN